MTIIKCAIYTRKATTELMHNSLSNQRLACEKYVMDNEGYELVEKCYEDNGFSGANMDRPGLQELLKDIEAGLINCVVVHDFSRLTRSILDFAKIIKLFDKHNVNFVAVAQSFNTATPTGRKMLHVILNFAQYEKGE